jgi:nicotinamide-nucleotide amidase
VLVGVGDELLLGHTVNTNGTWLGSQLSLLGFKVVRQEVVGDQEMAIREAVARGMAEVDLVLLTGGLGPTPDDLTRPAVANLLGVPLEEDSGLVERLKARFRARGYEDLPPNNRRMAEIPRGSVVLQNPVGAAPGLLLAAQSGGHVGLLPGIPAEMRGIFREGLEPWLGDRYGFRLHPVHVRWIYTTGIPESLLAQRIQERIPEGTGDVAMAFLPDLRGVRIRLTVEGLEHDEAETLFTGLEDRMEEVLEPYRYHSEGGDLAQAVGVALEAGGATLATAESCTGGLIAKRVTDVPGSSRYYLGGVVSYADEVKLRELGVPPQTLRKEGAVSRDVAVAMAQGVAERFGARAGIGVTGIAGPGGGSEEKPVGTVWYAAVVDGLMQSRRDRFPGNREAVRERAAQAALALLLSLLRGDKG